MKVLGYIWKIAGGICFIGIALLSSFAVCFCDGSRESMCTYFFLATWSGSIAGFIGHLFLLPRPVNTTTIYRLDILLLFIVMLFLTQDDTLKFFLFHGACALTILAAIISKVTETSQRKKQETKIAKTVPTPKTPKQTFELTDLLQAVLSGKTEQVQSALAQDPAQLNTPYAQNGNTPLHVAAWNGYKDIVQLLLAQPGIDTQAKNLAGKTALDLAKEKNFAEIIEMLQFTEQK